MSRSRADTGHKIIPAHLNFLAIYSPALGITEQTERDQILYYYAKPPPERGRKAKNSNQDAIPDIEDQLRQIGLAQGIVNFARTFSSDEPADSIETEKHRIVVTELENGWWSLASINLTRIVSASRDSPGPKSQLSADVVEYSSREVSPPALLRQQLLRANNIFLLHNGSNLSDLYIRIGRRKFCDVLDGFWTPFAKTWDVLLHGNPANDVYGGIKLAAGGELGIGVGEEQWGSGEREVLEGLVRQTEGLVDLTVSRYGNDDATARVPANVNGPNDQTGAHKDWLGRFEYPRVSDGLVFSGPGVISRNSLRSLTAWTQWIYRFGEDAYGVGTNSSALRRRKPRPAAANGAPESERQGSERASVKVGDELDGATSKETAVEAQAERHPDIPKSLISAAEESLQNATATVAANNATESVSKDDSSSTSETWMKYLTPDFGFSWLSKRDQPSQPSSKASETRSSSKAASIATREMDPPAIKADSEKNKTEMKTISKSGHHDTAPRFLIGLEGPLDLTLPQDLAAVDARLDEDWSGRLSLRTLFVELGKKADMHQRMLQDDDQSTLTPGSGGLFSPPLPPEDSLDYRRVRVVVYVHKPFIFTLLFEPNTPSLSMPSFFIDLHKHFLPLHKSMVASTNPANTTARIRNAVAQSGLQQSLFDQKYPVFDLIHDPMKLTVHSSIPNIPVPGGFGAEGLRGSQDLSPDISPWTRIEAINIHSQILNNYVDTRRRPNDFERTAKTNKGWSVVWMRLLANSATRARSGATTPFTPRLEMSESILSFESQQQEDYCEAILVRRASDQGSGTPGRGGGGYARDVGNTFGKLVTFGLLGDSSPGPETSPGLGSGRLADGIGVDARKYIEGLMNLNK